MNGWMAIGIFIMAILCFFAWILAQALNARDREMSDDEYMKRLEAYREKNQWP